ncbi:hypothetical protein ABBQ32_012921 [Trebouxia sp. C0010 RCD-2024]
MRRGRAPANNSDVLAMFRLVYSGEGATQPLVDDSSLTKEQKWQLLFDRNWQHLAPSSQTKWLVYLRKWKKWIDDHPEQPEGYLVFPSSKVSAFLSDILADCTASSSKDPHGAVKSARKALRHLRACQAGIPDDEAKFPSQPYIAGVTSRAKTATAEARQCEEADPSCSASTLSNEEYASLLDAAMRFPDKQVGLCVAAMVSCGLAAGFRSDDLQDTKFFMELICSVPAKPLPMQILALANNAGKANQDAQMTYAALANHRQPRLDCLAYLSQLVLYQLNVSKLPLLALIYQNNTSWRSYRMFFRDPSMATSKQTYYDLSTMLLKVAATMPDTLVKTKVMHLMRCSGTVSLAAAACSMDILRVWGRWARSEGVVGKSYLPKSPLSALPATGVLAGFGTDFMTNHAFGRGTVAVPVAWIDALAPHARGIFQAVRLRNRMRTGKADFSGQHCVESILYLAETFWQSSPFMLQRYGLGWWALQLPTVCFILGSSSFRQFEQQVMNAELEWNARPLSPQMTEAFDKISKQVCSLSEQIAHLQLSVDGMMQPVHSQTTANHSMPTACSSSTQARAARSPRIELEAQVGLSSGLSSVQEAVDEWFTGLHGFPAPPLLCEQAVQRGQRLSKKAIDNLSRRRHLPLRIQALATDRCWPLKKALAVYELVMQRHSLSLAELRDAVRLSSPVRHPDAKGGKPAQSQHVNRSPGLPLISISQFAAWVQQATDDIASMSISW